MSLIKKSDENREIAEESFDKGYYHIYVSRIYYSLYQRLMYISHKEVDSLKFTMLANSSGSHKDFIQKMVAYFNFKNNRELSAKLSTGMQKISKMRNTADYSFEESIDKNKANQVKSLYEKVINDLEKEVRR